MEIRQFAERVVLSESIADKLAAVDGPLTDSSPGMATRPLLPARGQNLQFCGRRQTPPMPHPTTFNDPRRRAAAHHIMANHELQALEVMGFVLLAFPEAPAEFRQGMLKIMADEQRHTRMHVDRLSELGLAFGALPVNGYFWNKAQQFENVLDYLAGLPLTFENRNLDHTLEFAEWFENAGDERGAGILRAIHRDEIRHVAFGLYWLRQLKSPDQSDWEAWEAHLKWPLRPEKARGKQFQREARLSAGMSDEFVDRLEQSLPPVDQE